MMPETALQDPGQIRELVRQRVADEQAAYGFDLMDTPQAGQISDQEVMDALTHGEDGDASLFIRLHQGRLLYDHAAAQWHVWAGHYWQEDILDQATASVQAVIEIYRMEAKRQSWLRDKAENTGQTETANKHKAKEDALFIKMPFTSHSPEKTSRAFPCPCWQ